MSEPTDFELRVRGEITVDEYVGRLEERVRQSRAENDVMRGLHLPAANLDDYMEIKQDLRALGEAFISLYLQALNGVVCEPDAEPGRHGCSACLGAWAKGKGVLDKYDSEWGNLYRSGSGTFRP